jgi:serine/threonine protein phosphatase PrpC
MTEALIRWSCAGRSDRGAKRKINEDSILMRTDAGIWLAADGMGGHEAGDVASAMVASAVARVPSQARLAVVVDRVESALVSVNREIRERAARDFGGRTMGSTVVSFVASSRFGVCLWAGDSRFYRLRDNRLDQLSSDHSEVQELVDRGLLTPEEAENHPNSNVITRAVGGAPDLFLDSLLVDVREGDLFVLCSDGLYNELSAGEIRDNLQPDIEQAADALLAQALAKGARDNVSLIVLRADAA